MVPRARFPTKTRQFRLDHKTTLTSGQLSSTSPRVPVDLSTTETSNDLSDLWSPGVERLDTRSDKSIRYVAKEAKKAGLPIRLRFTVSLFDPTSGQYKGWRGQNWKLPVKDIDEARRMQELLELFFDVIDLAGIAWATEAVGNAKRVLVEAQQEM